MTYTQLLDIDASHYPLPEKATDYILQWDRTYALLMGAEKAGVLDMPAKALTPGIQPGEETKAIESIPGLEALNPVRYKVMAEQLWLLGYLKNKPRPEDTAHIQSSSDFKRAVRRFQSEAGLTVDEWIGNQTWQALNAMVGFESDTKIRRWTLGDGKFNPAFRRAVQLRLWTYGLAEKKPGEEFNDISGKNIEWLKKVFWSLSLIDDFRKEISRQELFGILFDDDLLVTAAARFKPIAPPPHEDGDSFADKVLDAADLKGLSELKRRFLVNLTKVELWLLGSDIKIDGKDDYPVKGLGVKQIWKTPFGVDSEIMLVDMTDENVQKYLRQYWRELAGLSEKDARAKAGFITPSLFESFKTPEVAHTGKLSPFDETDYSKQIAEYFEKEHDPEALIARSYTESKNLGMNLWDGLKRLWRWVKRGINKIVDFAKNVFRTFYRFAMKGYVIVRTAFSAFARAMDQYLTGHIALDNRYTVTVQIEKDMDNRIIITDKAQNQDITQACKAVKRFGAMFYFSCKIVGLFIDILQTAATGLAVWAHLMMSLVKGYRDIVPAYKQLAAAL